MNPEWRYYLSLVLAAIFTALSMCANERRVRNNRLLWAILFLLAGCTGLVAQILGAVQ